MKRITISRELRISSLTLCALALAALGSCAASSKQQPSQQLPPPSSSTPPPSSHPASSEPVPSIGELPVKRRKVWTNDDVVTLRTPADSYLLEKEEEDALKAQEAMKAEAPTDVGAKADSLKDADWHRQLPSSIGETQLLIKNKEQDISDDEATLDGLKAELATAPEERLKAKQKEIEIVTDELDRAKNELKVLEDHLAELGKPPASVTAAPPPSSF